MRWRTLWVLEATLEMWGKESDFVSSLRCKIKVNKRPGDIFPLLEDDADYHPAIKEKRF